MINSNVNQKIKLVSAFDFCSAPVTSSTESAWGGGGGGGLNGAFTHVRFSSKIAYSGSELKIKHV